MPHSCRATVVIPLLAVLAACAVAPAPLHAQPRADHPVKARLVPDADAIVPGQPLRVGLLFEIEPTWHTYWSNPGDAGQAPSVEFTLPPGFFASKLQFPVPKPFNQPGDIIGYGYEDQVMMITTIVPPHDLPADLSQVEIRADARWLVCDPGVCIPGRDDTLSLSLPVAQQAQPANQDVFEIWTTRLPIDAGKPGSPAQVWWSMDQELASAGRASASATVEWAEPVSDVAFFPGASDAVQVQDIKLDTQGRTTQLTVAMRHITGQPIRRPVIASVIAYTNESGERRAVEVDLPLAPSAAAEDKPASPQARVRN